MRVRVVVPERPVVLVARPEDVVAAVGTAAGPTLLAAHERRRLTAFRHPADRQAYLAAHLLVRMCAARLTGCSVEAAEVAQECAGCGSTEHGRPLLRGCPDVHLGLAHSRGAVIAGAGWAPLGVDVEPPLAPGAEQELLPAVLTAAEADAVRAAADPARAFLRSWVLKESLVKLGAATLDSLQGIDLVRATDHAVVDDRAHCRLGGVHLVDWFDASLGVAFGVAASAPPVVATVAPAQQI